KKISASLSDLDLEDFDLANFPENFSDFLLFNANITGDEDLGTLEYLYVLPVIITIGVVGNAISLITIFMSRLRTVPANQYLIVMTTADTIFLLGVALIMFKVDYTSFFSCVLVEYVLMSASYVSAWATAALTIERYIALVHPLMGVRMASKSRVRWFFCWVPIPFVLHLIQFHILVPTTSPTDRGCAPRVAGYQVFIELADSFLCYVIPCSIVVVLNVIVAYQMAMSRSYFSGDSGRAIHRSGDSRDSKRSGGSSHSGHLTILWVVPMVFVLLNSPFYIVKLFELFEETFKDPKAPQESFSHFRMILHNTSHYLYYLNFSCDVIVYAFSSSHFRKAVTATFRKITRLEPKKKAKYTAMELSRMHNDRTDPTMGTSSYKKARNGTIRAIQTEIMDDVSSTAPSSV
ncbi:hypothetical protein PFISCL1PPCAC_3348, partial [Pristionchus fissidentatus]